MEYVQILKELKEIKGERVSKGVQRILSKEEKLRPGFSYTWVNTSVPRNAKKLLEYKVDDTTIRLYKMSDSTEDLYHVLPPEYDMDNSSAELVYMVKRSLSEHYPSGMDLTRSEQVGEYVSSKGKEMLHRMAKRMDYRLGEDRNQEISKLDTLSRLLRKYTAGYGIMETFLNDPHVEDIYVDAPSDSNYVYLELGDVPGIREKCRTNVQFSQRDMESILSSFRSESGKPFSEAFPILETDLQEYDTRVTVIGTPLSPDGTAFALRRRNKEPWTLPRLITVGSLTPLAAGLLSFLIDGRSTVLVAGSRGAGKTTLLGALMMEFPKSQRVLTIEDTQELPGREMQKIDYNVQCMTVGSLLEEGGLTADDALRVSLRLGESSIVLGEVRGQEARTLYEAMRAGTAGSAVMGTIHGNSPDAVYERVVHDMGISKESFGATDIIVIAGIIRPGGMQKRKRQVTHISEYNQGDFFDLMACEDGTLLDATDTFKRTSEKIGSIARSWGISYEAAIENINLRAFIRQKMVETSEKKGLELLKPQWVAEANDMFWNLVEAHHGTGSYQGVKDDWLRWYQERVRYV